MDIENIVVVPKLTKVEVDMHMYCLDMEELRHEYQESGQDAEGIFASHYQQKESVALLRELLPESTFISREEFHKEQAKKSSMIIGAGGDEHLKYLSHYVDDTPLLGINTDIGGSDGALLSDNLGETVEKIRQDDFEVRNIARIDALVNGIPHVPSMAIYRIGRDEGEDNFRYRIESSNLCEQHRVTTGLLVYGPLGQMDWPRGASRYLGNRQDFDLGDRRLRWVVNEPQELYDMSGGVIEPGSSLVVTSFKDESRISPDAIKEHKKGIQRGDQITFQLSEKDLRRVYVNGT